ncbi:hypothetical protein E2I00_017938 [Balaenoptera physalus]|uniref:F-box/WD repeat-containing protein 10 n=1 Tax=Balaenoptera physalus TaxID=9770 RepID=A0A643CIB4_BALPH|nr:hypothetical protein E2I00_017938 [Balaenoptera physalus]
MNSPTSFDHPDADLTFNFIRACTQPRTGVQKYRAFFNFWFATVRWKLKPFERMCVGCGQVQGRPGAEVEEEEEVLCDFCLGANRVRAMKSCLTCMVNYCPEHLRPHQENSRLQGHQLAEPVKDRDLLVCPAHRSPLVAFCCPDGQCICQECGRAEHRGHASAELRSTQLDLERKLKSNEDAIARLQANHKSVLVSVSEVKAVAKEQFGDLLAAMSKAQADVMLFLEEKEQAALGQANGIKTHLEYRSTEMEKTRQELDRIAAIGSPVLFLEEYCKFKNMKDDAFPSVYIGLKDKLSGIRKVITDSTAHLIHLLQNYKEKLQEFSKEEEYDIGTQVCAFTEHKHWTSEPEPSTRQQFLQYACDIAFDPDTAHRYLRLQEDNRKVTNTTPWAHPYPDLPSRFTHWRQVLAQQSLYLHRYYFEVELSGAGIYVGLTCQGIDRKGEERNAFWLSKKDNAVRIADLGEEPEKPAPTPTFYSSDHIPLLSTDALPKINDQVPASFRTSRKSPDLLEDPAMSAGSGAGWEPAEPQVHVVGHDSGADGGTAAVPSGARYTMQGAGKGAGHLGTMENMESRLKNAPYFRCEKGNNSVPVCRKCETCVLAWKIFSTKEWFRRVGRMSQRRFLVSMLQQLDSLYLLHYFQNILQTTQGKDFVYHRSRVNLSKKEGKIVKSSLNQTLDETVEQKMRGILHWFGNSSSRTKANYTLLLLQMCDPELLLTAADVIRALLLRGRNGASGNDPDSKDVFFFPEKGHTPPCETSQKDSGRVHSSMLDKNSLNRCVFVSQHWAVLAQQGSYTRGIDPNYANKVTIPVPKTADDGKHLRVKNQKWKLRTKNDYNLWTAYQNEETQQLQMEERNVFCGTYNIRILSDMWDRNRVIHYSGGDLLAVSSNRKIQLLDIIQIKQIPIKFRGHTGSVRTLFLCEEENFLLSGSYDLSIRYWDLNSGACIRIFSGHQGTITCMDVCKNKLASGAKDCQVKAFSLDWEPPGPSGRWGDVLCAGTRDHSEKPWPGWQALATSDVVTVTLNGHEGAVKCLCFDQWHLLSGSADGLVMAWSMVGKYEWCLMAFKHPKEVLHVALLFLRVISACADGKIRIYNFLNGNCLKVMKANGRGYPVLSFFIQGNRMVINTESNVLMFQFENIKWQYSLERAKQKKKDKEEDSEENGLAEVLSKSSTQIYSPQESTSSKQTAQESLFSKSHRSQVLLRASRLPTDGRKRPSSREANGTGTEQENLEAKPLAGDKNGVLMEASLSQGKPKSPRRDGRKRPSSREANSTGTEQENLEAKSLAGDKNADDVEEIPKQGQLGTLGDLISCSKKKSWCIPMLPDQLFLTVNALQKAHNSGEFAYPRRPQTQVIDAWGPSISYPRKVLSLKGQSVQHAVDRLRLSNPPIDVKQTSIALEIQKLQPNLKNSVHSPRVQSTIPQPVLICPRFSGSLKGEDPATSSADGAVRSFSPLTSTQVIKPNHMLAPPMGTTAQAAKKDRPRFYTALDPFRVNTEFMLLTVKEEKEYEEAKRKEFQAIKPAGVVDPEKASRAAWIRKIRGLPIDNVTKQGKTAAPELGQNVFI